MLSKKYFVISFLSLAKLLTPFVSKIWILLPSLPLLTCKVVEWSSWNYYSNR